MAKKIAICIIIFIYGYSFSQSREQFLVNDNWEFTYGYNVKKNSSKRITIPHTWNNTDALIGDLDYYRGIGSYSKSIHINKQWENKRVFLKFDGVNTVSNLFINEKHVGEHRGGYSSFIFEITNHVNFGVDNKIDVQVNNAPQLDVMPLLGDFNFYGGIYRDVHLLVTEKICINPLDFASPGVYLHQKKVSENSADVDAEVLLSNRDSLDKNINVVVKIFKEGKEISSKTKELKIFKNTDVSVNIPFKLNKPRLWNGRKDPFLHKVEIIIQHKGKVIDKVIQPLGLRFFRVDSQNGFFLNGKHLQLKGVCRHQDRSELGNALLQAHHKEDIEILLEMGANAMRLSHYPHAPYVYDLLDKGGIVTWSEIPLVGPGGYRGKGFVDQKSFKDNGKQQLYEMIRQNYNHPSIIFWGLFNELKERGDNPTDYVTELNRIVKEEDSYRISVAASNINGKINTITDAIAWNKYYGWYGGQPKQIGDWADNTHQKNPNFKIGVSEYGAGASIYHHQQKIQKSNPTSYWHPESWQAYYHEENWKAINERPFIWGSFIWNLFDFGAAHRTEGDRDGRNDKGLVSFNRKVKKDAFWFYKANWNKNDKVLHIANRRFINRKESKTNIKVYANYKEVKLFVNGKFIGQKNGVYATFQWEDVQLIKGENIIEVKAGKGKNLTSDKCTWVLE